MSVVKGTGKKGSLGATDDDADEDSNDDDDDDDDDEVATSVGETPARVSKELKR